MRKNTKKILIVLILVFALALPALAHTMSWHDGSACTGSSHGIVPWGPSGHGHSLQIETPGYWFNERDEVAHHYYYEGGAVGWVYQNHYTRKSCW